MANATDAQVQTFADQRMRPRCETWRSLINAVNDDQAAIGDVYSAVTQPAPTWTDNRTDGPPHLLTPSDVAAFNTVEAMLLKIVAGTASAADLAQFAGQLPVVLKACVRPVGQ